MSDDDKKTMNFEYSEGSLGYANNKVLNHEATISDYDIGDVVEVVCLSQDFHFFNKEIAVVTNVKREYYPITVKFCPPRLFQDGWTQTEFGFNPEDLKIIKKEAINLPSKFNNQLPNVERKGLIYGDE